MPTPRRPRIAVVLLQLGGPDSLAAVEPFLINLFSDPAILRVPGFVRFFLARLIANRRAPTARGIYEQIGGRSPILPQTEDQRDALAALLAGDEEDPQAEFKVFIAMRYWHPRAQPVAKEIKSFGADRIIALPLYPQFSTTTTASSVDELRAALVASVVETPLESICCYPTARGFVQSYAEALTWGLREARILGTPRILFSAHGLPEAIVKSGDPYPFQVEQSAAAILDLLPSPVPEHVVCYQSRVGPLKWIGPSTDDEVKRAARDGRVIVVCPLAFVSEHSETLVELDIEYRHLAQTQGAKGYVRIPAISRAPVFIEELASQIRSAAARSRHDGCANPRVCPADFSGCPNRSHA